MKSPGKGRFFYPHRQWIIEWLKPEVIFYWKMFKGWSVRRVKLYFGQKNRRAVSAIGKRIQQARPMINTAINLSLLMADLNKEGRRRNG